MTEISEIFDLRKILIEFIIALCYSYFNSYLVIQFFVLNQIDIMTYSITQGILLIILFIFGFGISKITIINPSIVVGLVLINKLNINLGLFFILAQISGYIIANGILFIQFDNSIISQIEYNY